MKLKRCWAHDGPSKVWSFDWSLWIGTHIPVVWSSIWPRALPVTWSRHSLRFQCIILVFLPLAIHCILRTSFVIRSWFSRTCTAYTICICSLPSLSISHLRSFPEPSTSALSWQRLQGTCILHRALSSRPLCRPYVVMGTYCSFSLIRCLTNLQDSASTF